MCRLDCSNSKKAGDIESQPVSVALEARRHSTLDNPRRVHILTSC